MWQPNLQIRDYAETLHFFMFKRSLVTMLGTKTLRKEYYYKNNTWFSHPAGNAPDVSLKILVLSRRKDEYKMSDRSLK